MTFQCELSLSRTYVNEIGRELSQNLSGVVEFSIEGAEQFCKTSSIYFTRYDTIDQLFYNRVAGFLSDHMSLNPALNSAFYTDLQTGLSVMVYPSTAMIDDPNYRPGSTMQQNNMDKPIIYVDEIKPIADEKNMFEIKKFKIKDYPLKPIETKKVNGLDFKLKEWLGMVASVEKNEKGVWIESYEFLYRGFTGRKNGMTYLTPMRNAKGETVGIFGVDIYTDWLSEYLQKSLQKIGKQEIQAFIFEKRIDGSFVVIAHSEKDLAFPKKINGELKYLCTPEEMKKKLVADMINTLPDSYKMYDDLFEIDLVLFETDGTEMLGMVRNLLPGRPPKLVLCLYARQKDLFAPAYAHAKSNFFSTLVVIIISSLVSLLISRATSKPLEILSKNADNIGKLNFTDSLNFNSRITEIRNLADSMNRMQIGLQSFIRYLPKSLLQSLLETGQGAKLGGFERQLTIIFTDIEDFTHFAEQLTPNELVSQLNQYFACFSSIVDANNGTVDKYIGDAVMAYWNAPHECHDHAYLACVTAIRGMQKLEELQKSWANQGRPIFKARIGINTGNAIVGNIGTEDHLNYTVIGDNINLASRLEGLNKNYGTRILFTEATLSEVKDRVVYRPVDLVAVKGKNTRVMVHELIGLKGEVNPEAEQQCLDFANAHKKYMDKNWTGALELFLKINMKSPDDDLVSMFIKRCMDYQQNSPAVDWDGGQVIKTK
ncbi:MAG: adenylate/guanylate cyclase domain-containing protein [Gemmataceae bacterium]